jgi:hypothetical protein
MSESTPKETVSSSELRRHLLARADSYALRGEFQIIGQPAALVANERITAEYFSDLSRDAAPDGYILGAGCGNNISMIEAFAATPRGMILVDVDPAVVYLGHLFVAALRRHATPEAFVEGFFCSDREGLQELAAEALPEDDPFELVELLPSYEERVWSALSWLTGDFSRGPDDVARLLEEWASYLPPKDEIVPVRTWIVRNYSSLHELAVADGIVVLRSTIFDPALLTAVATLPGFADSSNVVYLSNVVDHLLRRAMLRSAQWKLRLTSEPLPEAERINTPADFLVLLAESTQHLEILEKAAGALTCTYSSESEDFLLKAGRGLPHYTAESFHLQFNLDALSASFLGNDAPPPQTANGGGTWNHAATTQATTRTLYAAALRHQDETARALLETSISALQAALEGEEDYLAFCVAETAFTAIFVERSDVAEPLAAQLDDLRRVLESAVQKLERRREEILAAAGERSTRLLLWAQALCLSAPLLDDTKLVDGGELLIRKALASLGEDGRFRDGGDDDLRFHAEALARLVFCNTYLRQSQLTAASERACRVFDSVHPKGPLRVPSEPLRDPESGDGPAERLVHLASAERFYENARMALLFHGMVADDFGRVLGAMQLYIFSRMPESSPDANISEQLTDLATRT